MKITKSDLRSIIEETLEEYNLEDRKDFDSFEDLDNNEYDEYERMMDDWYGSIEQLETVLRRFNGIAVNNDGSLDLDYIAPDKHVSTVITNAAEALSELLSYMDK